MLPSGSGRSPAAKRVFLHFTVKCRPFVMALNDSCHLLIETKHHFIQKSGGLKQNLGGGASPLAP